MQGASRARSEERTFQADGTATTQPFRNEPDTAGGRGAWDGMSARRGVETRRVHRLGPTGHGAGLPSALQAKSVGFEREGAAPLAPPPGPAFLLQLQLRSLQLSLQL